MDLHMMKYKITDHNRFRVDSLAHQLEQVNEEIRDLVDEIKKGVDLAKELELTILEKKGFFNNHMVAAVSVIHEAEKEIKDLKPQDISVLSLYENPPKGLEPLIRCYVYLLGGIVPQSVIEVDIMDSPISTDWKVCKKLLRNGKEFIEGLYQIKGRIEKFKMSHENMEYVKFIHIESFNEFETIKTLSKTMFDLRGFLQNIISYYDLIVLARENETDIERTTTQLEQTSTRLLQAEEEMNKLKEKSDEIYKELDLATTKSSRFHRKF